MCIAHSQPRAEMLALLCSHGVAVCANAHDPLSVPETCCCALRLALQVADWPRSRWEIEDFCRGDVYGMGIVLWEIYTAAEPGAL